MCNETLKVGLKEGIRHNNIVRGGVYFFEDPSGKTRPHLLISSVGNRANFPPQFLQITTVSRLSSVPIIIGAHSRISYIDTNHVYAYSVSQSIGYSTPNTVIPDPLLRYTVQLYNTVNGTPLSYAAAKFFREYAIKYNGILEKNKDKFDDIPYWDIEELLSQVKVSPKPTNISEKVTNEINGLKEMILDIKKEGEEKVEKVPVLGMADTDISMIAICIAGNIVTLRNNPELMRKALPLIQKTCDNIEQGLSAREGITEISNIISASPVTVRHAFSKFY